MSLLEFTVITTNVFAIDNVVQVGKRPATDAKRGKGAASSAALCSRSNDWRQHDSAIVRVRYDARPTVLAGRTRAHRV